MCFKNQFIILMEKTCCLIKMKLIPFYTSAKLVYPIQALKVKTLYSYHAVYRLPDLLTLINTIKPLILLQVRIGAMISILFLQTEYERICSIQRVANQKRLDIKLSLYVTACCCIDLYFPLFSSFDLSLNWIYGKNQVIKTVSYTFISSLSK